jgi:hypothetical protein
MILEFIYFRLIIMEPKMFNFQRNMLFMIYLMIKKGDSIIYKVCVHMALLKALCLYCYITSNISYNDKYFPYLIKLKLF